MKKTITVFLILFLFLPVAYAESERDLVAKAIRSLMTDREIKGVNGEAIIVGPQNSLRDVVRVMFHNYNSEYISNDSVELIVKHLGDSRELVAQALYGWGFNYSVLERLRQVFNYGPYARGSREIDLAGIDPNLPAGIPEYLVSDSEYWNVNITGQVDLDYRSDIYWLLEQIRSMMNLAIIRADETSHSPMNLFLNRYRQIDQIINFTQRTERTLTQLQSLIITLRIKIAKYKNDPSKVEDFQKLKIEIEGELSRFVESVRELISSGQPSSSSDKTPWREFAKSITLRQDRLRVVEDAVRDKSIQVLTEIDEIENRASTNGRYTDDEIPELVLKLQEHRQEIKDLLMNWEDVVVYKYHARVHRWLYTHLHSEERGPYLEVERYFKERNIEGVELAPIEDELEVINQLVKESDRITNRKLDKNQILELRGRVQKLKDEHDVYVEKGPRMKNLHLNQRTGFEERFKVRNEIISDLLDLVIDSSYRHEAHQAKGYLGINFETELSERYGKVMERLKKTALYFKYSRWGLMGASGVGAACWIYLM